MNGSDDDGVLHRIGAGSLPIIYAGLLALAVVVGLERQSAPLLEAWLTAFLVLAGLASASLGLLMIGHLLGEAWLAPVRGPLEAAASTLPLIAVLAIPIAAGVDRLYPWTGELLAQIPPLRQELYSKLYFLIAGAVILVLWNGMAVLVIRRGEHPWVSALGLALMALTSLVSTMYWIGSREPTWWSSGFAFAYTVTQLTGAMALAQLVAMLRPDYPDPHHYHNLQRAGIVLALLTLWVWFAQFLIVWMANLPDDVRWFLARSSSWLWLIVGIVVPALMGAIAVLLPSNPGRWRLVTANALLLIQHLAHMLWLVRPAIAAVPTLTLTDLLVWIALGLLWGIWFAGALRERENRRSEFASR